MAKIGLKMLFKLPPEKAIKYFKAKNNQVSWDWHDVWQKEHKKAFTVAKAMKKDVLQDIRDAVDKAISEGQTFENFKKELKPLLQKKGWWGEQFVGDSNGNIEKVQLGSVQRLKTIYRVNLQTSYQVGRYETQMENTDNRPYWQYVAVMDGRSREEHQALNGLILPYDDPFWQTMYPPNGWGCRCRVRALSAANVKNRGFLVSSSEGCLSEEMRLVSKKTGEMRPVTVYTDPLTGQKSSTDVGWSHNPAA